MPVTTSAGRRGGLMPQPATSLPTVDLRLPCF